MDSFEDVLEALGVSNANDALKALGIQYAGGLYILPDGRQMRGMKDAIIIAYNKRAPDGEKVQRYVEPPVAEYESDYKTARGIASLISFLGWVSVAIGVILALTIFIGLSSQRYGVAESIFISLLPSIGLVISGLFLVAAGQVTRATVDNADHTREILIHLKNQPSKS